MIYINNSGQNINPLFREPKSGIFWVITNILGNINVRNCISSLEKVIPTQLGQ
jgi:hypothetical protein